MILKYFAEYLHRTDNVSPSFETLCLWLKEKLLNPPKCHEDKIIQAEIYLAQNSGGDFCLIGKNETGRNLIKSLYNYILGCQNIIVARNQNINSSKKFLGNQ